jgi:hypothetical protein
VRLFGVWLQHGLSHLDLDLHNHLNSRKKDALEEKRRAIIRYLPTLRDKRLGCWCAPQRCHGEILEKFALLSFDSDEEFAVFFNLPIDEATSLRHAQLCYLEIESRRKARQ